MMRALLKTVVGQRPDKDEHKDEEGQHVNVNMTRKRANKEGSKRNVVWIVE
jgi:hypothetical protein